LAVTNQYTILVLARPLDISCNEPVATLMGRSR
jgi:hypothetical protein